VLPAGNCGLSEEFRFAYEAEGDTRIWLMGRLSHGRTEDGGYGVGEK
jgi:hypothetical protein